MSNINILYIALVSESFGGVEQKIIGQFDALFELNKNTHLFLVSSNAPNEKFRYEINSRKQICSLVNSISRNAFVRRKEKFELIRNEIMNFSPMNTVIYFRYPDADLLFLRFLKKISKYRIVTEHQEIERYFLFSFFNGNYIRDILDVLYGKAVRSRINGFVGVTNQITNFQRKLTNGCNKKFTTIGNSIDVNAYPIRKNLNQNNEYIHILFVGSGRKPHGLFRVIESLHNYLVNNKQLQHKLKIKIAGKSSYMHYNKGLVTKYKLQDYFDFVGFKSKDELNELFNWADIGIGSLGLHKIGLHESSTLKAREYVARGLPFFWSTTDLDIPNNLPFVLKFDSNDNIFDFDDVIDFAIKMKKISNISIQMRNHAEQHLTNRIKMKNLSDFLETILL